MFASVVSVLLMVACGMSGGQSAVGGQSEDYPMPSAEQMAVEWLGAVLMSDSGRMMSGHRLARLYEEHSIRSVALPVSDKDVLPRMGTYKNAETGGTIVFRPYVNEKDTVRPVCQADFRIVVHSWEDASCLPDSAETVCVKNRGGGILTLYRIVHGGGPNGGKHRCYAKHPDGYPEYWGALIAVNSGADSLILTFGYEASKRIYRFVNPSLSIKT